MGAKHAGGEMTRREFGSCVLCAASSMPAHRDALCKLDTGIGDGDHGVSIERGFTAVMQRFQNDPGEGDASFYREMGDLLAASMGGAIGPIYGVYFDGIGVGLADDVRVSASRLGKAMLLATDKVMRMAKVRPGEKTIMDAMEPAAKALVGASDRSLGAALHLACEAAQQGVQQTIGMQAKKGRARFLMEKSIGHQDPGATSFAWYLEALRDAVDEAMKGD